MPSRLVTSHLDKMLSALWLSAVWTGLDWTGLDCLLFSFSCNYARQTAHVWVLIGPLIQATTTTLHHSLSQIAPRDAFHQARHGIRA